MARIDQSRPQDSEALTEYMSKAFNLSPAHVLSNVSYNSNEQLVSFAKAGSVRKASPMGAEEGAAAAEHAQKQYTPQQWTKMSGPDRQGAARAMSAGSGKLRAGFQKTPPEEMPEGAAEEASAPDPRTMTPAQKRAFIRQQNTMRQAAETAATPPERRYPTSGGGGKNQDLDSGLRAPADTGAFPYVGAEAGGRELPHPTLAQLDARKSFSMKNFAKSVNALEMISEKMIRDFGGR